LACRRVAAGALPAGAARRAAPGALSTAGGAACRGDGGSHALYDTAPNAAMYSSSREAHTGLVSGMCHVPSTVGSDKWATVGRDGLLKIWQGKVGSRPTSRWWPPPDSRGARRPAAAPACGAAPAGLAAAYRLKQWLDAVVSLAHAHTGPVCLHPRAKPLPPPPAPLPLPALQTLLPVKSVHCSSSASSAPATCVSYLQHTHALAVGSLSRHIKLYDATTFEPCGVMPTVRQPLHPARHCLQRRACPAGLRQPSAAAVVQAL
jgi:hypothetical protein